MHLQGVGISLIPCLGVLCYEEKCGFWGCSVCVGMYEKIPTDIKVRICVRLCCVQRESFTDTYSSIERV